MLSRQRYNVFGTLAILLWSCVISLTRFVAEYFGPVGGAALLYTVSSVLLMLTVGMPKFSQIPKKYLILGGVMFACYEIFLSLALGMANSRQQALDMAIINYLWPALTVVIATLISKKPTPIALYPLIMAAFVGVVWCVSGDQPLSWATLVSNIQSNPLTYTLALSGAFIWALYCNLTQKWSNGINAITPFFMLTAITLWIHLLFVDEPSFTFTWTNSSVLLLSAAVMAGGYGLWNIAIIGGNMIFLATLSYFTPVISIFISSIVFAIALSWSFWQGVIIVTLSSLGCWWLTREKSEKSRITEIEQPQ
ncbi:aromatic amino acid DMT transporter YddG [Vibrio maerlii]|uniref:aromatic amino acid DMT transporter YddG n=1 Tax=Vibrio maerlii TaxID=2231648 RepID=UPI000E3C9659|nr:aromatic amino acid DMT transporter YddG [Vibrio maerlii]